MNKHQYFFFLLIFIGANVFIGSTALDCDLKENSVK